MFDMLYFLKDIALTPLLRGAIASFKVVALVVPIALIIGFLTAVGRFCGNKIIRFICAIYVIYFRGTPLVVQLLIFYLGLSYWGIMLTPYQATVAAIACCSGAYHSEFIRQALQSIKGGQVMAAQALGMTRASIIFNILIPQALRIAIPPCSNEIIYSLKSSSLAMIIGYTDLAGAGKLISSIYFRYIEIFLFIGVVYLIVITIVNKLLKVVENKLRIPGLDWSI